MVRNQQSSVLATITLLVAIFAFNPGAASAAACNLTCVGGGTGTVTAGINTDLNCGAGTCPASCAGPTTLSATGQINITLSMCASGTTRTIAYCEVIANVFGVQCSSCNIASFGTGNTVLSTFTCNVSTPSDYTYALTVNDITIHGGSCSCNGACSDTICDQECDAESQIASCTVTVT